MPPYRPSRHALDATPDALVIVDDGGLIQYSNGRASSLFGHSPQNLLGTSIDRLFPERHRTRLMENRAIVAGKHRVRRIGSAPELSGLHRDGSEFPVELSLSFMVDDARPLVLAGIRDASVHRRIKRSLEKRRDAALQANEVKSQFLAAASHDLRQPLQTLWSVHATLSRNLRNADQSPCLQLLHDAVRSMDQMLAALIDINRLEKGAIKPAIRDFSLEEILPTLRSEFAHAASGKSLSLDVEHCTEAVRSDPMLLPVVLRNLLGNAVKYTQEGEVVLRVRRAGADLLIDVSDTGPGIADRHTQRLFEAFYQIDNPTKDKRRGIGLGLSIVQTICRLLDHEVTVHSVVGRGSVFTVRLPVGAPGRGPVAVRQVAPVPACCVSEAAHGTVLHIEDDPGVSRSMAMLLRLEGFEVVSAASRDEALRQIVVAKTLPDLILCDMHLPMGYTGDEVVSELTVSLGFKPPIIMLSGDVADRHLEKARLVADRLLPKPVDIGLLLGEMSALLRRSPAFQ